ncbi:MAG: hypothetical protein M3N18_11880 [Actinomycetota bacterium]|nr:hypothetical protein [Actinomycetota bacterium]
MDIANVEKVEADLNRLIERRAQGANVANEERERERARDARRTHSAQLVNARAWCAHYNALSLAAHDQAARYAEKRDEARALVEELETNKRGTAA